MLPADCQQMGKIGTEQKMMKYYTIKNTHDVATHLLDSPHSYQLMETMRNNIIHNKSAWFNNQVKILQFFRSSTTIIHQNTPVHHAFRMCVANVRQIH